MKTKLLILSCFFSALCFSQTITTFQSEPLTNFKTVTPSGNIDHTPTGANATWEFNNLIEGGTNIDSYALPTGAETTTYPGTTEVLSVTSQGGTPNVNKFFLIENGSGTSITGISQGDIILNYSSTNAFIGLFPMSFGTNNSNPASGTFTYQGTNGTFTGTITATVEAYGTLDIGTYSETVTRLRIDQSLSFSIPPLFNNIGTLTQTIYYYYNNNTNNLDFRSSNTNLVSGFLGINETSDISEFNTTDNTLSDSDFDVTSNVKLYPNPAQDVIHIKMSNNLTIGSLKITDNQGRQVSVQNKDMTVINISSLQSGLYFLSITTDSGKLVNKKFIKR